MNKKYLFVIIVLLLFSNLNCDFFNKKELVEDRHKINEFVNYFAESIKPEMKLITEIELRELKEVDSLFIISGTELHLNPQKKKIPFPYSFIRTELFILNYTHNTDMWYLIIKNIDNTNILAFQIKVLEKNIPYRINLRYYFSEKKLPSGKYSVILNNSQIYSESEIIWIDTKDLKFKKF